MTTDIKYRPVSKETVAERYAKLFGEGTGDYDLACDNFVLATGLSPETALAVSHLRAGPTKSEKRAGSRTVK